MACERSVPRPAPPPVAEHSVAFGSSPALFFGQAPLRHVAVGSGLQDLLGRRRGERSVTHMMRRQSRRRQHAKHGAFKKGMVSAVLDAENRRSSGTGARLREGQRSG